MAAGIVLTLIVFTSCAALCIGQGDGYLFWQPSSLNKTGVFVPFTAGQFGTAFPPIGSIPFANFPKGSLCNCEYNPNLQNIYGFIVPRGGCSFQNIAECAASFGARILLIADLEGSEPFSIEGSLKVTDNIFVGLISCPHSTMIMDLGVTEMSIKFKFSAVLICARLLARSVTSKQILAKTDDISSCIAQSSVVDNQDTSIIGATNDSSHEFVENIRDLGEAVKTLLKLSMRFDARRVLDAAVKLLLHSSDFLDEIGIATQNSRSAASPPVHQLVEKWMSGFSTIFMQIIDFGNVDSSLSLLVQAYSAHNLLHNNRFVPFLHNICMWQSIAQFGFALGSFAQSSSVHSEISNSTSVACSYSRMITVLASLEKQKAFEHDLLWLSFQELKYLVVKYDTIMVADYLSIIALILDEPAQAANVYLSFTADIGTCGRGSSSIPGYRRLDALVERLSEPSQYTFLRDVISVHSKLAVFWDEMGDLISGHRHQRLVISLFKYIFCFAPHHLGRLSNSMEEIDELALSSQLRQLSMDDRTQLMQTSLSCLFSRAVVFAPVIYQSWSELNISAAERALEIQRVQSMLMPTRPVNANILDLNPIIDALRLYFTSLYLKYSVTPPSMMIGYQPIFDAATGDRHILSVSHDCLRVCVGSISQNRNAKTDVAAPEQIPENLLRRLRVGFVSSFFFDHSVGRLINFAIQGLNRSLFHVHAVSISGWRGRKYNGSLKYEESDKTISTLCRDVESCIPIEINLGQSKNCSLLVDSFSPFAINLQQQQESGISISCTVSILQALKFDVVVFPELGMDFSTLAIASSARLAARQVVYWGHPLSQGIHHIDYFISSDYFEPHSNSAPQLSYLRSEQTVIFDSLTTYFLQSTLSIPNRDTHRTIQGLPGALQKLLSVSINPRVYFLPHTLMKYSIEFSEMLAALLIRDRTALLILVFSSTQQLWLTKILLRLATDIEVACNCSTAAITLQRVFAIERLNREDYYHFLSTYAPVILDPFPFGMGVTALEAFNFGVPIVTFADAQTVPALVHGFLHRMGLSHCLVASSSADYVEKAFRVRTECSDNSANVKSCCYENVRHSLQLHSHKVFEDASVIYEWESFLQRLGRYF